MRSLSITLLLALTAAVPAAPAPLRVVTTLPAYASIAQFVGGDRVTVTSISRGDEDAHFVKPKPSFALMLRDADLFVTTGLDLELWAPTLVDKSGNSRIRDGQPGFVSASAGVRLLDIPDSVSREAGDIHIYGNPHIHTSPLNALVIAANIEAGLERVDPAGAETYQANLERFHRRMDDELFGPELVGLLGGEVLEGLAQRGNLISFLEGREHEGAPLVDKLGGWLGRGRVFRGQKIVVYHTNWTYFTDLFGLDVAETVERKPGIPPSARHVHDLVEAIAEQGIRVLLASNYFSEEQIQTIAERTGSTAVVVPLGPMTIGEDAYFELIDLWVSKLDEAFAR